jgi:alkylation response protein AidB-like acyl-CoA dehydrogenase
MTLTEHPLTLNLLPTDEDLAIRESIGQILGKFGPHYARECWERGVPPTDAWTELGEAGFTGINVPEEFGGGGLGMRGLAIVIEEAARHGLASLMMVVSSAIAAPVLERHGTPTQQDRWLKGIAAGTTRIAFAITEPDAGTNTHEIRTELRREGDHYRLSGQKYYISGVEDAHHILSVARLRREDGTLGKPTLCIVDVDAPGLTKEEIPMPFLGADRQWTLFYDDVLVEADRIVGGEESGMAVVFDGLNPERIAVAAICTGLGQRAIDKAVAYANERQVWSTKIGAHQAVAHPLARAKVELELARLMNQKAAALYDAGAATTMVGEVANMAKLAAAQGSGHSVDAAIHTHGGNGISLEYGVSDLYFLVRTLKIAPVSEQMVLNHIAQHTLGLPKSY